jgi:Tfp pilus assembly PilM family ATPase
MSEILALDWDHEQVCGVLAHVAAGRVRVRRTLVLPRPADSVSGSGPVSWDWLRAQLIQQGISGGQVAVTLPRDEVVVKRLEVPDSSDDELPTIVRYQAGAKSSIPLADLSLDFIPLPRRSEIPGREVLMATVTQATIAEIRTLCESAHLQLLNIGLTPVAVAELVTRAAAGETDLQGESLVIGRHGGRVEISVLSGPHVLFSHSARLYEGSSGQEPQAIVAEVSRALVALRGSVPDVKITQAWTLAGPAEHEQLSETLEKRLDCQPRRLDPFTMVDWEGPATVADFDKPLFAGPLGMLLAHADPKVPGLDFLAPRQPVIRKDNRRRMMILAGLGVGLILGTLVAGRWRQLSDLSDQIAQLSTKERQLTQVLKRGEPTLASLHLIDQWQQGETPWLDELLNFTKHMPDTEHIYLNSLTLEPEFGASAARIKSEGFARQRDDIMGLNQSFLSEENRYRVLPHGARASTTDADYPWRFESEVLLLEAPPPAGESPPPARTGSSPAGSRSRRETR